MDVRTAVRHRNGHGYGGWGSDGCRRVKGLRLWSSKQNCQDQGGKHDGQSDNRPFHFPSQIESLYYPRNVATHLTQMGVSFASLNTAREIKLRGRPVGLPAGFRPGRSLGRALHGITNTVRILMTHQHSGGAHEGRSGSDGRQDSRQGAQSRSNPRPSGAGCKRGREAGGLPRMRAERLLFCQPRRSGARSGGSSRPLHRKDSGGRAGTRLHGRGGLAGTRRRPDFQRRRGGHAAGHSGNLSQAASSLPRH